MVELYIGWGAFLLDCLIGDPRSDLHPVVLMGKLIAGLEKIFYHKNDSDRRKFWAGAALVFCVLGICFILATLYQALLFKLPSLYFFPVLEALALSLMMTPRSLAEAGREIAGYLAAGDLKNARFKVGWIVGRDTDKLSPPEITRATVETVAENITDGIISPLFYWYLGGLPLAVFYRAANTMDSMLGYKNDQYLYFGRVAARFDDLMNYIPARLAGLLLVVAAFILGYDYNNAWRIMQRDAKKHPSPNGGYTEATVAGALGVRLGGLNYYFGQPHHRALMGDKSRELNQGDIHSTIKLMYAATLLFLLAVSALRLAEGRWWL